MPDRSEQNKSLHAPAKINLFLHVIGRDENQYHQLQSMVAFADFGDGITITPSSNFSLISKNQNNLLPVDPEKNLITKAARALAEELNQPLNVSIALNKNIPIGAGLGGGSSNAATIIYGLLSYWGIQPSNNTLNNILYNLGADVPVCYYRRTCYIENIGDKITAIDNFPTLYAVLIYPNKLCSTADIFKSFDKSYSAPIDLPDGFATQEALISFLQNTDNDLTTAAIKNTPEIEQVLQQIQKQSGCSLSRMSGSGSACFGLFDTKEQSYQAAKNIKEEIKDWFVQPVILGKAS